MKTSSSVLILAVAFLGLAAGCTSSEVATIERVDVPEISGPASQEGQASQGEAVVPEEENSNPAEETDSELPDEIGDDHVVDGDPNDEVDADSDANDDQGGFNVRQPGRLPIDLDLGQGEDSSTGVRRPIREGVLLNLHAPQVKNITHSGDGKTFIVVFTEPVDLPSLQSAFSLQRYEGSGNGFTPVSVSMTATGSGDDLGRFVRVVTDAPLIEAPASIFDPILSVVRITISGADSANPSQAVRDTAGNAMAEEFSWTGTCRSMPASAPYDVECK